MLNVVISALVASVPLAMLAIAFALVYFCCRVFHVALAGMHALAPFGFAVLLGLGVAPWVAVGVCMLAAAMVGAMIETYNHAPLARKSATESAHLVSSLGIGIALVQIGSMLFGTENRMPPEPVSGLSLAIVSTNNRALQTLVFGSAALVLVVWTLSHTKLGLMLRAMADDPIEAALMGMDTRFARLCAFMASGALCALAAILSAREFGFDMHSSFHQLMVAIVVMIISGKLDFARLVAVAVLVALVRVFANYLLAGSWQDTITFVVLILFLVVRPRGFTATADRKDHA